MVSSKRWFSQLGVRLGAWAESDGADVCPRRRDWVFAGVLAVLNLVEAVMLFAASTTVMAVGGLLAIAAIPFRRQFPLPVVVWVFALIGAVDLFGVLVDVDDATSSLAHGIAAIMALYALCRRSTPTWIGLGLLVVALSSLPVPFFDDSTWVDLLVELGLWLIVVLVAVIMRYRGRLVAAEHDNVRLAERHVLARELHDTVAHRVSAIAVQAQAAQFVGEKKPGAAMQALSEIEVAANEAIDEMRRMVGILRSEADEELTVAATSLRELARPDGTPRVIVLGDTELGELSAPIATALYRIAQESITNAVRHNEGVTFVDVTVAVSRPPGGVDDVNIKVINDGRPTVRNRGSGYGLVGMTERVEALGGTFSAGPRPSSGWQLAATLPLRRES